VAKALTRPARYRSGNFRQLSGDIRGPGVFIDCWLTWGLPLSQGALPNHATRLTAFARVITM
jgi:hypothetical protein